MKIKNNSIGFSIALCAIMFAAGFVACAIVSDDHPTSSVPEEETDPEVLSSIPVPYLSKRLETAVEKENFELAAKIRDAINSQTPVKKS